MKIEKKILRTVVITTLFLFCNAVACTTFCFWHNGNWVYGRNYDWSIEHCHITVNKRGVAKTSLTEDNPAQWVSKYGSITFNQYGREFPLGGMNEKGLVIECLWLQHTEYPHIDSRHAMREPQWIQYQLDNHATVDEVIESDKRVRISVKGATPLHFLVCDQTGRAATIEFLGGKMVVHTKDDLPVTTLTNNTYEYCVGLYNMFTEDEESETFAAADYSCKRFIWAAQGVKHWDPDTKYSPIDYAFDVLEKAAFERTMFRIVYDVKNSRIYFRTHSNPDVCYIRFDAFDFSCHTPVKIIDINTDENRDDIDVTQLFTDYTYEANYELISQSFSNTDLVKDTPEEILQKIARYPNLLRCVE